MSSSHTHEETPNHPLSGLQASIWVDQMVHGDAPLYNCPAHALIDAALDRGLFAQAPAPVVARHDALRLVMIDVDGAPRQQVLPPSDPRTAPALTHVDLSGADDPERAARAWIEDAVAAPFRLDGGPLCRFALIKVAPAR